MAITKFLGLILDAFKADFPLQVKYHRLSMIPYKPKLLFLWTTQRYTSLLFIYTASNSIAQEECLLKNDKKVAPTALDDIEVALA